MNKQNFQRLFELYYELTDGKPQIDSCPDVKMEINSISWSIKISIYVKGFTTGDKPDIIFYLNNEVSDDYVYKVLEVLDKCVDIKRTYLSNPLYDIEREKILKNLLKMC